MRRQIYTTLLIAVFMSGFCGYAFAAPAPSSWTQSVTNGGAGWPQNQIDNFDTTYASVLYAKAYKSRNTNSNWGLEYAADGCRKLAPVNSKEGLLKIL